MAPTGRILRGHGTCQLLRGSNHRRGLRHVSPCAPLPDYPAARLTWHDAPNRNTIHRLSLARVRPVPGDTPMQGIIANVGILQLLSYSLPAAASILGLGAFDVMREVEVHYGDVHILRHGYFVLAYNLVFVAVAAVRRVLHRWFVAQSLSSCKPDPHPYPLRCLLALCAACITVDGVHPGQGETVSPHIPPWSPRIWRCERCERCVSGAEREPRHSRRPTGGGVAQPCQSRQRCGSVPIRPPVARAVATALAQQHSAPSPAQEQRRCGNCPP